MSQPLFVIMGGPNGAGKSTASAVLLPSSMTFLNADEMAKELPGYPSPAADMQASRDLLNRMAELEAARADFAVETTLASRSLAAKVKQLRRSGYQSRLIFAFLPSPELAIARVAGRVRLGGHNIPVDTIRRRYRAGLKNLFELYQPLCDRWEVYDTTRPAPLKLVANGGRDRSVEVADLTLWDTIRRMAQDD